VISKQGCDQSTEVDIKEGLTIISERANSLSQFVSSYKQLAKLPEPEKQASSIISLINKVAALFEESNISIESTLDIEILVDPVQFEQVLINLFKNAAESMQQARNQGQISIKWQAAETVLELSICDQGVGISNPANLFVPFYSTKKQGSGIGLVLCRQVIEAHNGQLTLVNHKNSAGCCAVIEIPLTH